MGTQGHQAGKVTVTCKICEKTSPRCNFTLSDFDSGQKDSLAISRRPSWVSWSDLPREESATSGEDTVTEECAESHQSEKHKLGKILRTCQRITECNPWMRRKAALLAAASGPCAPSESTFPAVSDMSCVDGPRALTNSSESSARSCGKDTLQAPLAQYDTFHPDVFSSVELVARATNISRKRPRPTREPNVKRNVNCWHNLKSATRPLSKYY